MKEKRSYSQWFIDELINEEDKIGVKLSGYLEVNENTIFKLLLKYVDKDNVKKECYYIYNYQHN